MVNKKQFGFKKISKEFQDPRYINKLTCSQRMVIAAFMRLSAKHGVILVSQETLASQAGVSVRTVQKSITFMIQHGLLAKTNIPWKACRYSLSSYFQFEYVKEVIPEFYWAAFKYPLALMSPEYEKYCPSEKDVLIKDLRVIYNSPYKVSLIRKVSLEPCARARKEPQYSAPKQPSKKKGFNFKRLFE